MNPTKPKLKCGYCVFKGGCLLMPHTAEVPHPIEMRGNCLPLFRNCCSPTLLKITHFAPRIFLEIEACLYPILLKKI